ncbi:ABC transporter permease [Actinoplanes rectilineatus]|uniref:ABC transporter permease n=1 Tax=Actinoplanes rectilineatus TaxID=113571 RepID=UPI0009FA137C|nr:ABC transporter permease [Actinoplanes rectilineatus]
MSAMTQTVRLARLDLGLIFRNRSALTNAILMPLAVAALLIGVARGQGDEALTFAVTGQMAAMLLYAPMVNLAGFFTSRREELVLKRLLSGPAPARAILGGSALGAIAVAMLQILVLVVAAIVLGVGAPSNPVLMLAGALGGAVFFCLLAMVISGLSATGELAQLATVPVLLIGYGLAPTMMPMDYLPETVQRIAEYLPVTPIADLIRTGYAGGAELTATLTSLGVLAAWMLVVAVLARRYFRWDPRRG